MSSALQHFHPIIQRWFADKFGAPTEPQVLGWPHILAGRNTLIAAPTGSGKTLAAFLCCIDQLVRKGLKGELPDEIEVLYISPLKALSNDVRKNLESPLEEMRVTAVEMGSCLPAVRTQVRTGDTSAAERQSMLRRPPHILVTTPESLYLLLTSVKGRQALQSVRTVIVDEIHALARDKRGSHLALSLERLAQLCPTPLVRIGLSATQRPIDQIAHFLVGVDRSTLEIVESSSTVEAQFSDTQIPAATTPEPIPAPCEIIDAGHLRDLDLALVTPESELEAVCTHEIWGEVYDRLVELIQSHRSTLVFVNTRRLAERVAHRLTEILGEEAVASHHGSLSRQIRQSAEERLKNGQLKAIVATASLEMGIDVGYIDLVCQIGSPRAIATFLQRVGRAGHSLGAVPKGRLFPLTRDELMECLALVWAVRKGRLDRIEIPVAPLDILAQQIVAAVSCEEWDQDALWRMFRRAWPYRNLTRHQFLEVVGLLSEGISPKLRKGAYLHRDAIGGVLRARRGARLAAITCGGAIPDMADYRVVTEEDHTFVGTVNEDFAIDSTAGDIFLLGNTSWRLRYVRGLEVVVSDAHGQPATIPFWFGEAPGRTVELSDELSQLRGALEQRLIDGPAEPSVEEVDEASSNGEPTTFLSAALASRHLAGNGFQEREEPTAVERAAADWLMKIGGATRHAADQAVLYVAAQRAAMGLTPTAEKIVFERFFDESGGMQLVIHAPLGSRINRAWGLALRKRFCRSFDFELQAAADDNGVVLSLSQQHSFPIDQLFRMLTAENAQYLLEQALLAVPVFQTRWRWNVTRALAVPRFLGGKKVPPNLLRFRSEDLLAAVFPETVGCLENHHGDVEVPDHPLVRQTMHDCLHEAMDLDGWLDVLRRVGAGEIEFIARDTREPSPFSHGLLNANPYAFLDDAPLEERRARAVSVRRTLSVESFRDLCQLDPAAVEAVRREAWPAPRDADEMHDALLTMAALPVTEANEWSAFLGRLVQDGRAVKVRSPALPALWIASENWPVLRAAFPGADTVPPVKLPPELEKTWEAAAAWVALVRGRMLVVGPVTSAQVAKDLGLSVGEVDAALEALEGEGSVLRGFFTVKPPFDGKTLNAAKNPDGPQVEWCDRRLLSRIHRMTLAGLRRQIEPVEPEVFLHYLIRHQRLDPSHRWRGAAGVREAVGMLQGFELPAGAWEPHVLAARMEDYDPSWLDHASLTGEVSWGRLRPKRRDEDDGPSMAVLTRTVPISLTLREDLFWLLPSDRVSAEAACRSNASTVLQTLSARGALFQSDLAQWTQLLPAHLDEALQELAALGLITSDTFAAVRRLAAAQSTGLMRAKRGRPNRMSRPMSAAGRWSLFPGQLPPIDKDMQIERWAKLLLRRYGVLFRDLLTRESAAPSWGELAPKLRRMELRGDVRGGRFVKGVAGEQFALPDAVDRLRKLRDEPSSGQWIIVSAADPVNLIGVVTSGARIPATHGNRLALRDGRLCASLQGGKVEFHQDLPLETQVELSRALQLGPGSPAVLAAPRRNTPRGSLFGDDRRGVATN